jgi:hypothetical protein
MLLSKGILLITLVTLLAFATGCTTTTGASDPAVRRAAIDAGKVRISRD